MRTLKEFYELMEHTRDVRVAMVRSYADSKTVDAHRLAELKSALASLEAIPEVNGCRQLMLDAVKTIDLEIDYEVSELKKDIVFFEQGEAAFDLYLGGIHAQFERRVVDALVELEGIHFNNFVTDRDGTISNYCGRYRSSIQSAYNAIYLTRFSRARANSATVVTSAPLLNPGVADVSVMPVGAYIYAASKAREFIDKEGVRRTFPIEAAQQAKLDELNRRLAALVARPEYEKFSLIGSGLQFKFGETTLARQDISKSIPEDESLAFLEVVRGIMKEVDPSGTDFGLVDMKLDIEIILKGASEGEFSKADGLYFLDRELALGLDQGPTLVCGDTKGDLPLVKACMAKSQDVWAMFVTKDEALMKQVRETCPRAIVVPEVDVLVTVLNRLATREQRLRPASFKCAIFDLDGVVTETAKVHSAAWKVMFDEFLKRRAEARKEPFAEFTGEDYLKWVDGKPRYKGVNDFLASRGITIEYGTPDDSADLETVCGLGNRKNVSFQAVLKEKGAHVFPSSVNFIRELKARGIRVGVASSSKNTQLVLRKANLEDLFETRVCGVVSAELGLSGKPDPDIFVVAAKNLGFTPGETMMVEDAISGVTAGYRGNFGMVLGIARDIDGLELTKVGADVVVTDLGDISVDDVFDWFETGIPADAWTLRFDDYEPAEEKVRSALTTVGNGYLGVGGASEFARRDEVHAPGTQVAPAGAGAVLDWTRCELRIGRGEYVSPFKMRIVSYCQKLDMLDGVLSRTMVVRDKAGRLTRLDSRRFASAAEPHVGALELAVTPLNYSGNIAIRSGIDGTVGSAAPVVQGATPGGVFVQLQTAGDRPVGVAAAVRHRLYENGMVVELEPRVETATAQAYQVFEVEAEAGRTVTLEKIAGIYASTDQDVPCFVAAAKDAAKGADWFDDAFLLHQAVSHTLWDRVDVGIEGDRVAQRMVRLETFHRLAAATSREAQLASSLAARVIGGVPAGSRSAWDEAPVKAWIAAHLPATDVVVTKWAGLSVVGAEVTVAPELPAHVGRVVFTAVAQGTPFEVDVDRDGVSVTAHAAVEVTKGEQKKITTPSGSTLSVTVR
ncbi:MAG: HAD-IA family hydrolase [Polyangiaceae bacterium]|nr:HAD-IA family hydrolase [Polyangiaceae bacterium]